MKHKNLRSLACILLCCVMLSLVSCSYASFEGSKVKNPDSYVLDIETMNGTDSHTLSLREGDTLKVAMATERGSIYLEIEAPDGSVIYQGNGKEASEFTVNVPSDGDYNILVKGNRARGSVRVDAQFAPEPTAEPTPEPTAEPEPELTAEELAGPWSLAEGENDLSEIYRDFPGSMEFGCSMEIRSSGGISWYVGAEGAAGVYTLEGNVLTADVTEDLDGVALTAELTVEHRDAGLFITMTYHDKPLVWSWGE